MHEIEKKDFKVCLAIFQHYAWKGEGSGRQVEEGLNLKHLSWTNGPLDWFLYDRNLRHERVNPLHAKDPEFF